MLLGIIVLLAFLLMGYLLYNLLTDLVRLEDEVDALKDEVAVYKDWADEMRKIVNVYKNELEE